MGSAQLEINAYISTAGPSGAVGQTEEGGGDVGREK